jgi:hypothetical protein
VYMIHNQARVDSLCLKLKTKTKQKPRRDRVITTGR